MPSVTACTLISWSTAWSVASDRPLPYLAEVVVQYYYVRSEGDVLVLIDMSSLYQLPGCGVQAGVVLDQLVVLLIRCVGDSTYGGGQWRPMSPEAGSVACFSCSKSD